ncbi:MAG: MarR family transcriptional regulator [Opitutaceae bacterium]|nr:MarR family transcriptional regulator [Opitutaceae bacterium]
MPLLLLKDLPRYECLLEAAKEFPDLDPSACEAYLNLLRTSDEVHAVIEGLLAEYQISSGRFGVLMLLGRAANARACGPVGGSTPAELADAAGVARATMTGLVDTLERDGLVRREPNLEDRRMMSVVLTPAGNTLIRSMLPKHFQLMAALMQPLTVEERKTLVGLLHKVLRHAPDCNRRPSPSA